MKRKIWLSIIILLFETSLMASAVNLDKKISLQLDDISITTVLQTLARQHELNMVVSSEINGKISLRLSEVSLKDALDAILNANGYNYVINGNVLVVKPAETDAVGELEVRVISLDYVSPAAVVNASTDLLSSKGKIKVVQGTSDTKSNNNEPIASKVAVIDIPGNIEIMARFIKEIDKPEPQIAIEVRMIETNFDSEQKIGFNWPTSIITRLHGISTSSTSGTDENNTEAALQKDLNQGGWTWGKLSAGEVQAMLEFLETDGNSKLISDPRVTTMNNHKAEIKVNIVVPIQTINRFSEGGSIQDIVTYQDEEIGIALNVTPHIAADGNIIMDVDAVVAEIIGQTGPAEQQRPITSERTVKTRIPVKDNESAVIGGLLKESEIEDTQGIFLLGSIPILGHLFQHKTITKSTTDLTILITPKIIRN